MAKKRKILKSAMVPFGIDFDSVLTEQYLSSDVYKTSTLNSIFDSRCIKVKNMYDSIHSFKTDIYDLSIVQAASESLNKLPKEALKLLTTVDDNEQYNGSIDLHGKRIVNCVIPTNASDAATKEYVDNSIVDEDIANDLDVNSMIAIEGIMLSSYDEFGNPTSKVYKLLVDNGKLYARLYEQEN